MGGHLIHKQTHWEQCHEKMIPLGCRIISNRTESQVGNRSKLKAPVPWKLCNEGSSKKSSIHLPECGSRHSSNKNMKDWMLRWVKKDLTHVLASLRSMMACRRKRWSSSLLLSLFPPVVAINECKRILDEGGRTSRLCFWINPWHCVSNIQKMSGSTKHGADIALRGKIMVFSRVENLEYSRIMIS